MPNLQLQKHNPTQHMNNHPKELNQGMSLSWTEIKHKAPDGAGR
jgi:hypothetical protein